MADLFSQDERSLAFQRRLALIGPAKDLAAVSAGYALTWLKQLEGKRLRDPLLRVLLAGGFVDERGRPRRDVKAPVLASPLGVQFADFHEAVTRSLHRMEEMAHLLRISAVSSQWYSVIVQSYAEVLGRVASGRVVAPYIGEVFPALEELGRLGLEIYGYDKSRDALEDLAEMGVAYAELAPDACAITKASFDAAALLESLHWFANPYKELLCLAERLRPGAKIVVGNVDAAALPSLAALFLWSGASGFFTVKDIDDLLASAGLLKVRQLSRSPYYFAVWEKA